VIHALAAVADGVRRRLVEHPVEQRRPVFLLGQEGAAHLARERVRVIDLGVDEVPGLRVVHRERRAGRVLNREGQRLHAYADDQTAALHVNP
jgi:hypothetical protein